MDFLNTLLPTASLTLFLLLPMFGMVRWAARAGSKLRLQMGDGDPGGTGEAFTTIAQVVSITPFPVTADLEDMTDFDSVEGFEDAVKTIRRTGEAVVQINYDPSGPTHARLLDAVNDDASHNFKLLWPDNKERAFAALVTGFEPAEAPVSGAIRASVRIKVIGKPSAMESATF